MGKYLMVDTSRRGYTPSQVDQYAFTVEELIEYLKSFDKDSKVLFRNDGGYTYGAVTPGSFEEAYEDEY